MKHVLNYFHFSRNERLGAFALLFFCTTVFFTPLVLQWFRPPRITDFSEFEKYMQVFRQAKMAAENTLSSYFNFDPNIASEEDFKKLGLSEKTAHNICNYREKGGSFRKPEDFKKIWSLKPEDYERLLPYIRIGMGRHEPAEFQRSAAKTPCFSFDPNTASEAELFKLSLPERTVKSILNYRSKGGSFRKKEDLAKIFTLSEADYQRLEPCITFPATLAETGNFGNSPFKSRKTSESIDINRADVAAWTTLPMIGEKRAQQIVSFREKMGGFLSVEQLTEMYNFPDSVFQRIRPQLRLEPGGLQKINLNTASVERLDAHPYISRKQADLIVAYRDQHGPYSHPKDILNIKAFTDKAWWEKVSPYFSAE